VSAKTTSHALDSPLALLPVLMAVMRWLIGRISHHCRRLQATNKMPPETQDLTYPARRRVPNIPLCEAAARWPLLVFAFWPAYSSSSFPWDRRGVPLPLAIKQRPGTAFSCCGAVVIQHLGARMDDGIPPC
jgi:hypothetical protein